MASSIRVDCPNCGKQAGVRSGARVVKKVGREEYGVTDVKCACGTRSLARDLIRHGNLCHRALNAF